MITSAIAKRYAKALVMLAAEQGQVDRYHVELQQFCGIMASSPELRALLRNPAYGIEDKRAIISELSARASLSTTITNFLLLLLDRNRLSCLAAITESVGRFADELAGIVRPTLVSALPISDEHVTRIRAVLESMTGKKAVLTVQVDPDLIGGLVTKLGDKVFDGSIRTQLRRIQDTLQKG